MKEKIKIFRIAILTLYFNIIGLILFFKGNNQKLISRKVKIGIIILMLKNSVVVDAQTFKMPVRICYYAGPSGTEKSHQQKFIRYHDLKIGSVFNYKEFKESVNISYGHNVKFANIGFDMNYFEAGEHKKALLVGAYLKLSPYSLTFTALHSKPITFHIITSINYSHSVKVNTPNIEYKINTFNIGFLLSNIYRNFALEGLLAHDFNISTSFDKNLSLPIIGTNYPNGFYAKISIHYILKQNK